MSLTTDHSDPNLNIKDPDISELVNIWRLKSAELRLASTQDDVARSNWNAGAFDSMSSCATQLDVTSLQLGELSLKLCHEIETLPASEQQTKVSLLATELLKKIRKN